MNTMDDDEIDGLERGEEEMAKCRYIEACPVTKYNQCYNHSYVLCDQFETFYHEEKGK